MSGSPWLPWLYQYGVGGSVFAAGVFAALRSKALRLDRRDDRRMLGLLVGGLLAFALVHAAWIWRAVRS